MIVAVGADRLVIADFLAVGDDFPVGRRQDASLMASLKIRLVEAREHDVAVVRLQLRIDVLRAVGVVFEVLHALAIAHIKTLVLDRNFVLSHDLK